MMRYSIIVLMLLVLCSFSVCAVDISTCPLALNASTSYTMTANCTTASYGYTINGANTSLDCNGFFITGDGTAGDYGVDIGPTTTGVNATVKNCNIRGFGIDVRLYQSTKATIQDNNLSINTSYVYGTSGIVIYFNSGTTNNTVVRNNIVSTALNNGFGILLINGNTYNVIANNVINVSGYTSYGGVLLYANPTYNTIANNTINAMGSAVGLSMQSGGGIGNIIINNTFINSTVAHIYFDTAASNYNNVICLNNFTNSAGVYVRDYAIGGAGYNLYNCTYNGINQGNIYANVMSGSVEVIGRNLSSVSGLYVGDTGAGYPYGNSTSANKFVCTRGAACVDYAPLTRLNFRNIHLKITDGVRFSLRNTFFRMWS